MSDIISLIWFAIYKLFKKTFLSIDGNEGKVDPKAESMYIDCFTGLMVIVHLKA